MMTPSSANWIGRADAARDLLAKHAPQVDRDAAWPTESMTAVAEAGLLGLTAPASHGGAGQGPRTFAAVVCRLAEGCASTAMIYLMHTCATQVIASAQAFQRREQVLKDIAGGRHISTLAFSEKGSRSHFWAPVSQANANGGTVRLSADKSWVTSAGHADSYVVSTRSVNGTQPTASTLYYVPKGAAGMSVVGRWTGLGLRGNASAPMRLENVAVSAADSLSADGDGFSAMINVVLPWFQLGSAAVAAGICRCAVNGVRDHLSAAKLEHMGQSLASLPNLRADLARMHILTDSQLAFLEYVAGKME